MRLPLKGAERALVVPQSAVVYDVDGGAWVYEAKARARLRATARRARRRRPARALIVRRGLAEGVTIVTVGAAELYSTEFYVSK